MPVSSSSAAVTLIHTFITSWFDYCNVLLVGVCPEFLGSGKTSTLPFNSCTDSQLTTAFVWKYFSLVIHLSMAWHLPTYPIFSIPKHLLAHYIPMMSKYSPLPTAPPNFHSSRYIFIRMNTQNDCGHTAVVLYIYILFYFFYKCTIWLQQLCLLAAGVTHLAVQQRTSCSFMNHFGKQKPDNWQDHLYCKHD